MTLRGMINGAVAAQQQRRDSKPAPWLSGRDSSQLGQLIARHTNKEKELGLEKLELILASGGDGAATLRVYMSNGAQKVFTLGRRLLGVDDFEAAAAWMVTDVIMKGQRHRRDFVLGPQRASRDLQPGKKLTIEAKDVGGAHVS